MVLSVLKRNPSPTRSRTVDRVRSGSLACLDTLRARLLDPSHEELRDRLKNHFDSGLDVDRGG